MSRAVILGGSGAIGAATTRRLLGAGWEVDIVGRHEAHVPVDITAGGARFIAGEREDPRQLTAAFGGGADLLVDCICYTPDDAATLIPLARDTGSTVMISSKAVYVDRQGRHTNSEDPPRFDGPVVETQPTMAPGDGDYRSSEGYGANKVAAEQLLLDSGAPVTVLRPSKVHGRGAKQPREWVFVKRVLDRRRAVLLARRGTGVDHTTAAANIAALIEVVAAKPASRILNSADPDAPTGLDVARTVARQLGHTWEEILLDDDAGGSLGRHPWDARYPIVLDMTAATDLGYVPAGDYAATVADEVDWLVWLATTNDGSGILPGADDPYFGPMLDYAAEDRYLSTHWSDGENRAR